MASDGSIPTRHSLILRLKNWQDEASWDEFFQTYRTLIYSVALKAGLNDQEAQEVLQETVITVAKKIKDFDVGSERGSYTAWLLNIARWRIADQFRKRLKSGVLADASESAGDTSVAERLPDPATVDLDRIWNEEWKSILFEAAVERLRRKTDPASFQMFDLHVLRAWPADKVAKIFDVTAGQVYFAKYKLVRLLKDEIKRLEAESL